MIIGKVSVFGYEYKKFWSGAFVVSPYDNFKAWAW
jgi:hypothetical protein